MEYYNTKNIKFAMPDKVEAGSAGEQPARNYPASEDKHE
jgi:hypothetical protein